MLDIGLEVRPKYSRLRPFDIRFNPSCAGYRSGRFLQGKFCRSVVPVSILLVLDIGLEAVSQIVHQDISFCFNPSCAGYRSGRRKKPC